MADLSVDVMLTTGPGPARRRAVELAATGVDGVFTFENAHDVFFPLVLAAGATDLDLMTNVAIALPRSPVHLAHAAYDLQLLSEGRFRLGLGSQVRAHVERRYGSTWSHPVARMRDWVGAVRAVLDSWQRGTPLDYRGEFTSHTYMPPVFNPGPNPFGAPPVLLGALGPRMTEAAAEVADGLLVMPFNSAAHFRERTLPALHRGLAAAGRARAGFEVVCEVIVAVGETDAELAAARDGARSLLAFYASTPAYRPVLEVEGWEGLQPELQGLARAGRWADMAARVGDDVVDTLAVSGSAARCAAEIVRRFGDEAARVCCYFPGYAVSDERIASLVAALRAA